MLHTDFGNMKKTKLISKVFYNSVGGFMDASAYAKENNMKLVTTQEEFADNNKRYQLEERIPTYYMFTFETYI